MQRTERGWRRRLVAAALLIYCPVPFDPLPPWEPLRRQLTVGLKLFPAVATADRHLERRRAGTELLVLVLHEGGEDIAGEVAGHLRQIGKLKEIPLRIETVALNGLSRFAGTPVGAIFLATPLSGAGFFARTLEQLPTHLFSPFEGDVERGAVAGVQTGGLILPHVNMERAEAAGIRFKPFFLRVAQLR